MTSDVNSVVQDMKQNSLFVQIISVQINLCLFEISVKAR